MPAWLTDYLRANLMAVVWQSAVVLGGVILAVHFLYIGFFPDIDWQSSLALLAVIALTGLSIWVLISLLLTFPSFTWVTILEGLAALHKKSGSDPSSRSRGGLRTQHIDAFSTFSAKPPVTALAQKS